VIHSLIFCKDNKLGGWMEESKKGRMGEGKDKMIGSMEGWKNWVG